MSRAQHIPHQHSPIRTYLTSEMIVANDSNIRSKIHEFLAQNRVYSGSEESYDWLISARQHSDFALRLVLALMMLNAQELKRFFESNPQYQGLEGLCLSDEEWNWIRQDVVEIVLESPCSTANEVREALEKQAPDRVAYYASQGDFPKAALWALLALGLGGGLMLFALSMPVSFVPLIGAHNLWSGWMALLSAHHISGAGFSVAAVEIVGTLVAAHGLFALGRRSASKAEQIWDEKIMPNVQAPKSGCRRLVVDDEGYESDRRAYMASTPS